MPVGPEKEAVTALTDSRVTATLENILLKPLLTRIQENDEIITQLTSEVNNLRKTGGRFDTIQLTPA